MTRELAQIIDKETGDVNELRDKKLADATSQSVINTNDAIEMKTTTGEQVFITKDSFMQAIGQAFSASDPKTFTKLLGMNNGSPMGIGASDLASVLGALPDRSYSYAGITKFEDFKQGIYEPSAGKIGSVEVPINYGMVICFRIDNSTDFSQNNGNMLLLAFEYLGATYYWYKWHAYGTNVWRKIDTSSI